jgi:hypothetical protein
LSFLSRHLQFLPVKRFIRNKATGLFFAEGAWCHRLEQAQQFDTLAAAIQAAVQHHLKGTEVILQVGDQPNPFYDVRMDLLSDPPPPSRGQAEQQRDGEA